MFDPPRFLPPRLPAPKLRVGYIGSDNPWNVHAIRRLHEALLPWRDRIAHLDIVVAGPICQRLSSSSQLFRPLGIVAEPEDFYREVDLVVNPMEGGTGLKIKSVEALKFGLPLFSTSAGSVGIGSSDPHHNFATIEGACDGARPAEADCRRPRRVARRLARDLPRLHRAPDRRVRPDRRAGDAMS